MFGILKLENILSAFTKIEASLEAFLKQSEANILANLKAQNDLAEEAQHLTAEQAKAERTLERVKALTQ